MSVLCDMGCGGELARMIPVSFSTYNLSVSMRSIRGLDFFGFESGEGGVGGMMGTCPEISSAMAVGTWGVCRCPDMSAKDGGRARAHHAS